MANIYNILGTATTVGGLLSNALGGGNRATGGEHASWAKQIPQHIKDYGIQRDNLGLIMCPVPKVMRDRYGNANDQIYGVTRRSDSFNVPGTSIPVTDVRRYSTGPSVKVPIGTVNSTNFTINMIADQRGLYYQWMVAWMDGITNFNGRSSRAITQPNTWGSYFYEVNYFTDYSVDLTILEMDEQYNSIIETKLVGAYPVAISDKQINWGSSGLMSFNVEFVYTALDTKIDKVQPPGTLPPVAAPASSSALGTLLKGLSIAQALTSMRGKSNIGTVAGLVATGASVLSMIPGGVSR